jgi:hypothetical protein
VGGTLLKPSIFRVLWVLTLTSFILGASIAMFSLLLGVELLC